MVVKFNEETNTFQNILDQVNTSSLTEDKENEVKDLVSDKFHYKNEDNPQVHVGKCGKNT